MWWIAYAISGILAMYASLLIGLVFIANMIYVLSFERKNLIKYGIASIIILSAYMPWLIEIIKQKSVIVQALSWHGWFGGDQNILTLFIGQLHCMSYAFVTISDYTSQMNMFSTYNILDNGAQVFVSFLMISLFIVAIIFNIKKAPLKTWVYLSLIILLQVLLFSISDIIRNTNSSLIYRYHILNIIGIFLFLVYYFSVNIGAKRILHVGLFLCLIAFFVFSNIRFVDGPMNSVMQEYVNTAAHVSKNKKPLVITNFNTFWGTGGGVAVLNECKSNKIDVLWITEDTPNLKISDLDVYSEVYLMYATIDLEDKVTKLLGEGFSISEVKDISSLKKNCSK